MMSITKLTDTEVAQRVAPIDERALLESLARSINEKTLLSAAVMAAGSGVQVHIGNRSGRTLINEICPLPNDDDSPFEIASKRRFLRAIRQQMQRMLITENSPGAA